MKPYDQITQAVEYNYSPLAKVWHWLLAGLIGSEYLLGTSLSYLPDLIWWHRLLGLVIMLLVVWRLIWRLTHDYPPVAGGLAPVIRRLARALHGLLYGLMLATPLSGILLWLQSPANPGWSRWHVYLTTAILYFVLAHVLLAFLHQFVMGQPILNRMLPRALAAFIESDYERNRQQED